MEAIKKAIRGWLQVIDERRHMEEMMAVYKQLTRMAAISTIHTERLEHIQNQIDSMLPDIKDCKWRTALLCAKKDAEGLDAKKNENV